MAECYLCDAESDTRDHVPPKAFFDVVPANVITVPACANCNNSFARVRAVLENRWLAAKKPDEDYIWPGETSTGYIHDETVRRWHLKALETSKVRHFVLHSIRHTFLTRLGESGCDVWTLARIAGHNSIKVSSRYVHPSEDAMQAAILRLGGHKIGHNRFPQLQSSNETSTTDAQA